MNKKEHVSVMAPCCVCEKIIWFDPKYVPAIRPFNKGKKKPLCLTCFQEWNRIHRTSKGLEPLEPHEKAYFQK